MNESDKEYIRRAFAELTGLLEDASAKAAEGQSSHLTARASGRIVRDIEKVLVDTGI